MGHIATSNIMCNLSADQAWEKMRDISKAHLYVPGLTNTKITTTQKEGLGASRRVYGKHGVMDETVTEWNDGRGFTIRLHKGDKPAMPFKEAHFTYRIDKIDDKRCKLTTTMIYEMPWGGLGKLLNSLFFARIVYSNVRDVVLSMKNYYETNQATTADDMKKLRLIPEEKLPQPYQ
jgi:ribosome-associated toxin RatA of RatAB toxin-antitoxin module